MDVVAPTGDTYIGASGRQAQQRSKDEVVALKRGCGSTLEVVLDMTVRASTRGNTGTEVTLVETKRIIATVTDNHRLS